MIQLNKGDFTIHNIPFGIFSTKDKKKRVGTIIDDLVVDIYAVAKLGYFNNLDIDISVFKKKYLNAFIKLGKPITNAVRICLQELLASSEANNLKIYHHEGDVKMHLPIKIGNYTDFYSSKQHATNVGTMFRDPSNALLPNWKHMPVAYHGRASSIFISGTNFHRPKGQINASDDTQPIFSPTKRLDIELEMATIIGKKNKIGHAIDVNNAEEYVFGYLLFNDWSARDIQRWEYVPLGPFLAKNFFSSVSAWIVTYEALEIFKIDASEPQFPNVLPYLNEKNRSNYDIQLNVYLQNKDVNNQELYTTQIIESNFRHMYWSVAQQIAHHTVNGCNLQVGDLLASGTISGSNKESFGSLLELTWGGKNPILLPNNTQRTFLEDGDTVIITGHAEKDGKRVGFGKLINTVLSTK